MVRARLQAKYGDAIYTDGYKVVTTIDSRLQTAARVALRTGLLEYDRRHGYRGPTAQLEAAAGAATARAGRGCSARFPVVGGLRPGDRRERRAKTPQMFVRDLGAANLTWEKMSWARRELPDENVGRRRTSAAEVLTAAT